MPKLYPKEGPQGDSELIYEVLNEILIRTKLPIDLGVQYLANGFMAVCNPMPPHISSWNVMWDMRKAQTLDTGIDPKLSLAHPDFDRQLEEHIHRIYRILLEQCSCGNCKRMQRRTLKEEEAGSQEPQK